MIKKDGKKAHPTQKPVALLYRILMASTQPEDIVLDPFFGMGTSGVVAKQLHRHWIGIEKNPEYVELASERIRATTIISSNPSVYTLTENRRRPRVPFGNLLENGLLHPGQELFLGGRDGHIAIIQTNGTLTCNGMHGTIHTLAHQLLESPGNGWEEWFYEDPDSGELCRINELRLGLLAMLNQENTKSDASHIDIS